VAQTAAAAAKPTSGDAFLSNPSLSSFGDVLKSNPGAVLSALGLGYDIMNQGNVQGLGTLTNEAGQLQKQGQALSSYVNNNTLPAGAQAAVNQAKEAAKAQIRAKYGQLGMSGSTAETQDLANSDVQAVEAQYQIASQLLNSGIQESGLASELLARIVGINQAQDAATGAAIGNFASSLGSSANDGGIRLYMNPTGH
jgi:hypothetical protein